MQEEIRKYLEENLKIEIEYTEENNYGYISKNTEVRLMLNGKEISSDGY
tara:strand:+ start:861 stop:1007 length:147 start_codon:yes stop_codon:yes gene_type:complete